MRKGIIVEHTLVETFDGSDIHKKDNLEPNTQVEILGETVLYGITYIKIRYGRLNKEGFVDASCIVRI